MIVDRSPITEASKPTLAVVSAVLIPSIILTPRLYFLYGEALKFRSVFKTEFDFGYML